MSKTSERDAADITPAEAVGRWLGATNAPVNVIATQERVVAELAAAREFITAHTLVERGVNDFDLQGEAVERLRRASEHPSVAAIIRAALSEGEV